MAYIINKINTPNPIDDIINKVLPNGFLSPPNVNHIIMPIITSIIHI